MQGNKLNISIQNKQAELDQDMPVSLYDLIDRYNRKVIIKAPHQRKLVWEDDKIRGWIKRLQGKTRPVGVILTYEIINEPVVYLNDGLQRIHYSAMYFAEPYKWGDTPAIAEINIRNIAMPRQHRYYQTHDEAVIDFQHVNLGSYLTAYEMCAGILTCMKDYNLYESSLAEIIDCLNINEKRIIAKKTISRGQQHRLYRNAYGIFYRFLTEEKQSTTYEDIPNTQIRQMTIEQKQTIENKLREQIEKITLTDFEDTIKKFTSFVERETSMIESIWYDKLQKTRGDGISSTLYRWIMDVAIYRRNNGIPISCYEDFVLKLLLQTRGSGVFPTTSSKDGKPYNRTVGLSRLGGLSRICKIIEAEDFMNFVDRPSREKGNTKAGYDNSDITPYSLFGRGDVFSEPASKNRARGAKKVT